MSWAAYAGIFVLFLLSHSVPLRPAIKGRLVALFGARAFGMMYGLVSLGGLALLIWAAGQAPFVLLWPQMPWQRPVVYLGMLVACLILAMTLGRPNPFSFGGRNNDHFLPQRAGIVRWVRHPVLAALALWAGVHLLPNGDLAHVILFGVLGGFAVIGRALINRRKQREMGQAAWQALADDVAAAPVFYQPASWRALGARLLAGFAVFIGLAFAHPLIIGVAVH